MDDNDTVLVELTLSGEQYERLATLARSRQLAVGEIAQVAVGEWLDKQARLDQARSLMRELGLGLGEGRPPYDAARKHDTHLYPSGD